MIEIRTHGKQLVLCYTPETPPFDWVGNDLNVHGSVTLARTFHFEKSDITSTKANSQNDEWDDSESTYKFVLGVEVGAFFSIKARILGTKFDVRLSKELSIDRKTFIAHRGISIFPRIDRLISEPIIIGESEENSIPIIEFNELLKHFPTTTELNHYSSSRISLILKNYFDSTIDAEQKLNSYLKRKPIDQPALEMPVIYEYEVSKYQYIRDVIYENLANESSFSEADWQSLMLKFILLLFPKYIAVLEKIKINDYYSKSSVTRRFIDIALIDSNGNLDVIEIKKPFSNCIISSGKYRNNYTPKKELSGAIMQVEKYIFHLNKWGQAGEKEISKAKANELPSGMSVKITNPKAIIIVGRSNNLTDDQNFDFELIKRKYAIIIDVITYDDLLARLDNIIEKFRKLASTN